MFTLRSSSDGPLRTLRQSRPLHPCLEPGLEEVTHEGGRGRNQHSDNRNTDPTQDRLRPRTRPPASPDHDLIQGSGGTLKQV